MSALFCRIFTFYDFQDNLSEYHQFLTVFEAEKDFTFF